jgi:hypothetical protein
VVKSANLAYVGAIAIVTQIVAPILSLAAILRLGCGLTADVRADNLPTLPAAAATNATATTSVGVGVGVGVGVFARALGESGLVVTDGTRVARREVEHEERSAQQAAHADAHEEGGVADESACLGRRVWNGTGGGLILLCFCFCFFLYVSRPWKRPDDATADDAPCARFSRGRFPVIGPM